MKSWSKNRIVMNLKVFLVNGDKTIRKGERKKRE
jgi:hypothetical protein